MPNVVPSHQKPLSLALNINIPKESFIKKTIFDAFSNVCQSKRVSIRGLRTRAKKNEAIENKNIIISQFALEQSALNQLPIFNEDMAPDNPMANGHTIDPNNNFVTQRCLVATSLESNDDNEQVNRIIGSIYFDIDLQNIKVVELEATSESLKLYMRCGFKPEDSSLREEARKVDSLDEKKQIIMLSEHDLNFILPMNSLSCKNELQQTLKSLYSQESALKNNPAL
jgi:hypothetical protein